MFWDLVCYLIGHRLVESRDGFRCICVRCGSWWLSEVIDLQSAVDRWLDDESFIRTEIPRDARGNSYAK